MHFRRKLIDCFNYYDFDPQNKVAEVVALGEIDNDNNKKFATNKLELGELELGE